MYIICTLLQSKIICLKYYAKSFATLWIEGLRFKVDRISRNLLFSLDQFCTQVDGVILSRMQLAAAQWLTYLPYDHRTVGSIPLLGNVKEASKYPNFKE